MHVAFATAIAVTGQDADMPPVLDACAQAGIRAQALAWDDPTVSWSRFDAVVLRSTWDYTERMSAFMAWCERVDRVTVLLNPLPVLRWNIDKHYLADLAAAGVPVVATRYIEPEEEPLPALRAFLTEHPQAGEFVVKPAISAGSRDTQRYARAQEFAAGNHIARLLDAGRSVMLQPYLASVDAEGETALLYFDGTFSHAIRKGPLLRPDEGAIEHLFAAESITARVAGEDEIKIAEAVLAATRQRLRLDTPPAYARVDLLRAGSDRQGSPQLLELELAEPSLFFAHGPGSAERFVQALISRLPSSGASGRAVTA